MTDFNCMAKVPVYNTEGKEQGSVELNDAVFGVQPNNALVHQVYLALRANARQPWAHTKDRSDVRGGGKKPWKQKGTGRARHGSIRSPIWRGGGITFGPQNVRNYKQKINTKMKKAAVRMGLSDKVADQKLVILDAFAKDGKTKSLAALRGALPGTGKTTLLVTAEKNDALLRAAKNVARVDVVRAADANLVDLLHHQYVIADKETISALEKRLA